MAPTQQNVSQAEMERQKRAFIQKMVEIQRKKRKEPPKSKPENSR